MSAPLTPIVRTCPDCRTPFVITAREQTWWNELARMYPTQSISLPKRCSPCRGARRRAGTFVSPRDWDEPRASRASE